MVKDEFRAIFGPINTQSLRSAVQVQPELVVAMVEAEEISKLVKSLAIEELAQTLNPEYIDLYIEALNDERIVMRQGAVRAFHVMIYNDVEKDRLLKILEEHDDEDSRINKEITEIIEEGRDV